MAGKKTKFLKPKKPDFENLETVDVLCPICRTILIEPVTLPCNHGFCNLCFNDTMQNANLVCPLCRIRVGSWLRRAKKENKLINELFWNAIKEKYPKEVQNKYRGIDNEIEEGKPMIVLANPGEIRKEYELQKQRDAEELNKIREAEEKASEELIKKLKAEDEFRRTVEEEKLRLDAEIAKKLAKEFNPSTSNLKKSGPMDRFVKTTTKTVNNFATKDYTCRVLCLDKNIKEKNTTNSVMPAVQKKIQQIHKILEIEDSNSGVHSSDSAESSDLIESEYRYYFKPIETQKISHKYGKLPVRIPGRRATVPSAVKILPPSGKVTKLQMESSAFISVYKKLIESTPQPQVETTNKDEQECNEKLHSRNKSDTKINGSIKTSKNYSVQNSKRKNINNSASGAKKIKIDTQHIFQLKNSQMASESPPFYGFTKSESQDMSKLASASTKNQRNFSERNFCTRNGVNEHKQRKLQEEADFALAKKLQAEFDKISVLSRTRSGTKKQVTLDDMLAV